MRYNMKLYPARDVYFNMIKVRLDSMRKYQAVHSLLHVNHAVKEEDAKGSSAADGTKEGVNAAPSSSRKSVSRLSTRLGNKDSGKYLPPPCAHPCRAGVPCMQ